MKDSQTWVKTSANDVKEQVENRIRRLGLHYLSLVEAAMKITRKHHSQLWAVLLQFSTLFVVMYCENGLNPQAQNLESRSKSENHERAEGNRHIGAGAQHDRVNLPSDGHLSQQLHQHQDSVQAAAIKAASQKADGLNAHAFENNRDTEINQEQDQSSQSSDHKEQHLNSQQQSQLSESHYAQEYPDQHRHSEQQQQFHSQHHEDHHFQEQQSQAHLHGTQKQQQHQHVPPAEYQPIHSSDQRHQPQHSEDEHQYVSPTSQSGQQLTPPANQYPDQHDDHSSWKSGTPPHPKSLSSPSTHSQPEPSPQAESSVSETSAVPPLLLEDEDDDGLGDSSNFLPDDDDDFQVDTSEDQETQEENNEPELTPEQKKAEELFQAGEKLINATYYKEYHEAFLNFLEASKLNHQRAKEYIAFGYLFGDYLPQNVTKSAELFEELASLGSPRAQMGLAFMYSAGFHYNSSQAKALIYSTFGALGGDPLAQMALGYRYYAGIGVESSCETALTYYRKVATKVADAVTLAGGPVMQRILLQEEAENVGTNNSPMLDDDLLQYYHFLADKGDQQAQVVLGTLYYQGGKGVQINHEQAYHYFSTAAESGSGHALGYLGKMHSEGSPFIMQSNQTAFEYFKKSSEKKNHIGQAGLGMMYLNGLGVEKDVTKAFRYFSLASDQGSVDGQLQLGIMYFSGNGVRTDYKLAVKYFTMASQKGHVLAYYNLAQMHATGTGVLRNCYTAVELFKNVAERGKWSEMMMDAHRMYHEGHVDTALVKYMFLADLGYEVAQSNVAYLLDSGSTHKFNLHETHQRALLQYSRAASQGSTLARLKMGDYYYYGLGTDVDYESAASHYRMASEQQNNAQAMFNLGYMHERGLGLKQDVHLAKRFYDMAAETSSDAHVPVTMALMKLGLLYGVDVFSKEFEGISGVFSIMDPVAYLGPQWDLYLATTLAGVVALIYVMRRMR
ncbi:sel-1-like protein 1 [Plakobranchus ocellatus]|uniref:Sel-1-like protein 1 n=1 Tax=Plakobranchus ocellatus TaxID=259542 RepID=A0AAV4AS93_9GAST|nr:sel-1-like protein 1 [Plakobranchus ocellatus]